MLGDKIEDFVVGGNILHEMRNDEVHKNVHIKTTEGSIVKAHSGVLAAVSPKFKAIFEENDFGIYNLSTTNVSATTWGLVLDFVYTGSMQVPSSQGDLNTLLNACEALALVPLLSHLKAEFDTEDDNSMSQAKGDYVCNICNLEFSSMAALKSHRGHHKRGTDDYKCDICSINCRNEKTLLRHKRMYHQNIKQEMEDVEDCDILRSLKRGEEEEGEYQCNICGHYSVSLKALAAHKGHHTRVKQATPTTLSNVNEYACNQCDRAFASSSSLATHKRIHQNQKQNQNQDQDTNSFVAGELSCEVCHLTFLTSKSLHAHRGHHSRKENNERERREEKERQEEKKERPAANAVCDSNGMFACHKCDQTFHSRSSLQSHIAYHRRTGPTCPICNQKCLNSIYLQRHMSRCHKGAAFKDKKLKSVAGRTIMKTKLGMLQKKRIKRLIKGKPGASVGVPGSGITGLLCPICAQKFDTPSYLRAHLQQEHANFKNWRDNAIKKGFKKSQLPPFWGDYLDKTCKDCGASFDNAMRFTEHRTALHNDPKPFACNRCGEKYTSRVGIRGHVIRIHEPRWRLFHCPHCTHVTDIAVKARNHHQRKHPSAEMPTILQAALANEHRPVGPKNGGSKPSTSRQIKKEVMEEEEEEEEVEEEEGEEVEEGVDEANDVIENGDEDGMDEENTEKEQDRSMEEEDS